jgi:hypothetical protein
MLSKEIKWEALIVRDYHVAALLVMTVCGNDGIRELRGCNFQAKAIIFNF